MSGGKHPYSYGAFGLRISSALELPELFAIDAAAEPDIRLDLRVDTELQRDDLTLWDVRADGSVTFRLEGISYVVTDGNHIDIAAPPETDPADIRIWLLGTVISALLLQRGLLVLHANAVAFGDDEAAAFLGASGDGKSTLAAALSARGRRVLCDDLLAVDVDNDGAAWVRPGIPRVKVGPTAAAVLGIDLSDAPRVAADIDKYQMPLDRSADWDKRYRLTRLYRLEQGELDIAPAQGRAMGALVIDNIFRPMLDADMAGQAGRFSKAMAMANTARGFTFSRPFDLETLALSTDTLEAHLDRGL
ncbi:hypothetical protein [Sphingomicrobium sediminis]|uniref:Hpr(Ser) kinase/phosphatase n=1 Tax=Sphingomicrobium sediminis TaxID=2950949 RepID=A0A9X2EHV3_9SPHN|nr:hypothetical protein [Sphingomicrobium sediminis]MCM8558318.1 hypothetical protein [Sphingomicrobium sediminis]